MSMPVFDDVEPLPACGCEECARRRLTDSVARDTGGPATGATARVVVVAAAAGTALGGAAATVVAAPLPAGATGFTTGQAALAAAPRSAPAAAPLRLTRDQIIRRARGWTAARVPYSMTAHWRDGYRQDCSGFVSMAWGLGRNAWTGSLADYGVRISKAELAPGDILLFHNAADPQHGSHTVIFGGWVDDDHTAYTGYEQTTPATRVQTTPYAYWSNSGKYIPYRYKYLVGGGSSGSESSGSSGSTAFPGTSAFGPGADNASVTRLGTMLVGRGAGAYYKIGPGPRWSDSDRKATSAFQRAQGWSGSDADGLPGPTTWSYLVLDRGHDIPGAGRPSGGTPAGIPPFPGAGAFRPGQTNDSVLALGGQLVAKGFGKNYKVGPSRTWGEADRRNVEAFQRSLGWTGRDADGYPGPETWRRLFT
jgi:hypothetical protein